ISGVATVAQANAALGAAGVTIIGGLPAEGILLVAAPDTADLSGLHASLQSLQANTAVRAATPSVRMAAEVIPHPPEFTAQSAFNWYWRPTPDGGTWGLVASRFPQAWNLLEATRLKNPQVQTGIIDVSFNFLHGDLSALQPATLTSPVLGLVPANDPAQATHG